MPTQAKMLPLIAVLLTVLIIASCGEVTLQRKYEVHNYFLFESSPEAQAALQINLPVDFELTKKYDTNPNIAPQLSAPLVGRNLPSKQESEGNYIIVWSAKEGTMKRIPLNDKPQE